jgi:hypothetical protein
MKVTIVLLVIAAMAAPLAQTKGGVPRTADGHPDLSGLWQGGGPIGDIAEGLAKGETIPLLPSAKKIMDGLQSKDDPEANCLPTGVPRIAPYPWRIVQTRTHVFFLFEGNIHSYRQIFIDGRPHPKDPDPTWYGHSIGRWDGDTLVVDSVGFNDKFWFDFKGHPHTERLHDADDARQPHYHRRSGRVLAPVHRHLHGEALAARRRTDRVHLQREQHRCSPHPGAAVDAGRSGSPAGCVEALNRPGPAHGGPSQQASQTGSSRAEPSEGPFTGWLDGQPRCRTCKIKRRLDRRLQSAHDHLGCGGLGAAGGRLHEAQTLAVDVVNL